ncbi:hypothetical protein CEN39_13215 [Fischerella thermalis CCMEE 5201]|nr:hypothetical protein CEN39_13215 [Fischerella thermalis CCMEE 5201]
MNEVHSLQKLFLAADGDDVGSCIEYYILRNEIEQLSRFSLQYEIAINWLQEILVKKFNASIIFAGGDTLLAVLSQTADVDVFDVIEVIRIDFGKKASGRTLSIGIGSTPQEAHIALKYAKVSGKNRLSLYKEIQNG